MDINAGNKKFTLYQYQDNRMLLVAIPNEYVPFIRQAIAEYGDISQVPSDRTVRGIFITDLMDQEFDPQAQQNNITINHLSPMQ